MLSLQLRHHFASLGARLRIRTQPNSAKRIKGPTRLAIRSDEQGKYFELLLPQLSPRNVAVLAIRPRDNRLLMQLTHGSQQTHLIVQTGEQWSIRALAGPEAQALLLQLS